ncbi:MAG: hypothetical protein ACRDNH_09235 [Gaiellaceae bacterium]
MGAPAIETAGLTKFYGETRGMEDLVAACALLAAAAAVGFERRDVRQ